MQIAFYFIGIIAAVVALGLLLRLVAHASLLETFPLCAFAVLVFDTLLGHLSSLVFYAATAFWVTAINIVVAIVLVVIAVRLGLVAMIANWRIGVPRARTMLTVIAYIAILGCIAVFAQKQYGPDLSIHYSSIDPANHLFKAMDICETGKLEWGFVTGMFFTHYLAALWIQLFSDVWPSIEAYKAFILSTLFLYVLGSWLIFSVITKLAGNGKHVLISLALTMLCITGYPLNDIIFGFSYLGAGVSMLVALVSASFLCKGHPSPIVWAFYALFLYGQFVAYWIFIPISIMFVLALLSYAYWDVLSKHVVMFIGAMCIILLAGVIGVYLGIASGFLAPLAADGHSYRDLIGSFLPLLPFVIAGLVLCVARRPVSWWAPCSLFVVCLCAVAVFLVLHFHGLMSGYYYYKLYYAMWVASFFVTACCFGFSPLELVVLFRSYLVVWCALFAFSVSGCARELSEAQPEFEPAPAIDSLFGVYVSNLNEMRTSNAIALDEVELWDAAYVRSLESDQYVPILGSHFSSYWYEGVSHTRAEEGRRYYQYWLYPSDAQSQQLEERLNEVRYVGVLDDQLIPVPADVLQDIEQHEVVFSNAAGRIFDMQQRAQPST